MFSVDKSTRPGLSGGSLLFVMLNTFAIFLAFLTKQASANLICSYYSAGSFYNISCPDVCCSGSFNTADQACCSNSYWNTSIYIGLSVPIFCCLISLLGGISYCCMVVKPSSRSNQVSHLRSDSGFVSQSNNVPVKDDPPAYNELFKSFQAKSAAAGGGKLGSKSAAGIAVREEINSIDRTLSQAGAATVGSPVITTTAATLVVVAETATATATAATKEPSAKKSSLNDDDDDSLRTDSPLPPPYRSDIFHIV